MSRMTKTKHLLSAAAMVVCGCGPLAAGTLVVNNSANGTDVATGISTAINYTHLIDIN